MNTFVQARKNMVDCQLNTNGIIERNVLDAFGEIPREKFLPEPYKSVAYIDSEMKFGLKGPFLMEPLVHARMVQAMRIRPGDSVLNIGDATGYSSAIFAKLGAAVYVSEDQTAYLSSARTAWQELGFDKIETIKGDFSKAAARSGPYNFIFINGAVSELPKDLMALLSPGGRLAAVLKPEGQPIGMIVVAEKLAGGVIATRKLSDANSCYLAGYEPKPGFKF